jgi:hypothetical protein
MSYDLLVFDPEVAPRNRDEFILWYKDLTQWGENRNYNSSEGTSGNLKAFYDRLRVYYPPMNGPEAYVFEVSQEVEPRTNKGLFAKLFGSASKQPAPKAKFDERFVTDYSIAENAIYMGFAWAIGAEAYSDVVSAAIETGVGFFDVSANNGVIMHDRDQLETLDIL